MKYRVIYLVCLLIVGFACAATKDSETTAELVIDEGILVDGAEGVLKREATVDVWSFVLDKDVKIENKTILKNKFFFPKKN